MSVDRDLSVATLLDRIIIKYFIAYYQEAWFLFYNSLLILSLFMSTHLMPYLNRDWVDICVARWDYGSDELAGSFPDK